MYVSHVLSRNERPPDSPGLCQKGKRLQYRVKWKEIDQELDWYTETKEGPESLNLTYLAN
jgi:hypothetical protein